MNDKIFFKSIHKRNPNLFAFEKGINLDAVTDNYYSQYQVYDFNSIKHLIKNIKRTKKGIYFSFMNNNYIVVLTDLRPFIAKVTNKDNKNWFSYTIDFGDVASDLANNINKIF